MAMNEKKKTTTKTKTQKKAKPQKTKMEFSKFAFICTAVIFAIVIIGSFVLMWRANSTDALTVLIPSTSTLTITATGFYYHKAKVENVIKLSKENGLSINEIIGLEKNIDEMSDEDKSL